MMPIPSAFRLYLDEDVDVLLADLLALGVSAQVSADAAKCA